MDRGPQRSSPRNQARHQQSDQRTRQESCDSGVVWSGYRAETVFAARASADAIRSTVIKSHAGILNIGDKLKKLASAGLIARSALACHNGRDGWQSGLMHLFTKQTSLKGLRGFESLTIRHEQPPYEPTVVVSFFGVLGW